MPDRGEEKGGGHQGTATAEGQNGSMIKKKLLKCLACRLALQNRTIVFYLTTYRLRCSL